MPRASWDFIGDLQIPIPPLEEQRTIAAYLDRKTAQIDTLIAKKQRLIDLLQEQRTAVINRAVTRGLDPDAPMQDSGIEWLGEVPAHWTMVRVKHLAQMSAGPFGSSLTKDMYTSSGYRVYGQEQVIPGDFSIGDYYISEDKYNDMSRYQVSVGDVLVSCVGTFGKVAVVPEGVEPGVINPRLIKLTPNKSKVDPEYLELILKAKITFDQLEQVSRGGTMGVINIGLLSDIVIPLPPLEEQRRILSRVRSEKSEIDTLIQREELLIEKLQELRTSLISEVVTGKIDIRDEVPQRAEVAA
jgi:type I restriction enzyme S subunit